MSRPSHRSPVAEPVREQVARKVRFAYAAACVEPCRGTVAYLTSAVLGIALALHVLGLGFLLGRSEFWGYPPGDANMQLAGYYHYVHDGWHWPILRTTLVGAPEGVNVLQLDTIPLVALIGKLLASVSGQVVNLYGAWMLACYVLQAVFATRVVRAMGERTLVGAVVASVIALGMHAFLLRFYHQGLCAHFVPLWALALYFELGPQLRWWRAARSITILLLVALMCHPYLAAMAFPVVLATLLRGSWGASRREVLRRALVLLFACVSIVAVALATGHISGAVFKGQSHGYGQSSLNLLSPFLPLHGASSLWPSVPRIQDGTGLQWDGAFFLGFGVVPLLFVHLVGSGRELLRLVRRHVALVVLLLGVVIYALSSRIYLSSTLVVSYPIPRFLFWITNQFRATGRIFWPVGYFVALASIVLTLRRFPRRASVAAVVACAALHAIDARASMQIVTTNTRASWPRLLDWPEWQAAIAAHERVRQIPTHDCYGPLAITRPGFESREVQYLAAREGRPINGMRTARSTRDCAEELRTEGAVLVEPGAITLVPRLHGRPDDPRCVPASSFFACSDLLAKNPELLRSTRADSVPAYTLGSVVDFLANESVPRPGFTYLDPTWGQYTGDRIFTAAEDARIRLRVSPEKPSDYELGLYASARFPPDGSVATVHVLLRDTEVGTLTLTPENDSAETERTFRLPRALVPEGEVRLSLRVDGAEAPEGPAVAIHRFVVR